jgi:hypothetical protein
MGKTISRIDPIHIHHGHFEREPIAGMKVVCKLYFRTVYSAVNRVSGEKARSWLRSIIYCGQSCIGVYLMKDFETR